jgi:hypothetical protein
MAGQPDHVGVSDIEVLSSHHVVAPHGAATREAGFRPKYFCCSRGCGETCQGRDQVFVVFGFADGGGYAGEAGLAA